MPNILREITLRRPIPILNPLSFLSPITTSTRPAQTNTANDDPIITSVVDSLQQGHCWKILSENFGSVKFTNPTVRKILLQLKEPVNSKKALTFFHWSAQESRAEHGISSYCVLIHILVKTGLVRDAKAMIESVLTKKLSGDNCRTLCVLDSLMDSFCTVDSVPFVFDLFVQTCAKLRMVDDILDACKLLFDRGFPLSVISLNTVLNVLLKSDKVHLVWGLYELMIGRRVSPNEMTVKTMVGALCKEGKLEKFLRIVDRMNGNKRPAPHAIVNTCLVYEIVEDGRIERGLGLLRLMLNKNMILDTIAYSLVVFAKVRMEELDLAKETYEQMLRRGFKENAFVYDLFVGRSCEEGRIDEAIGLLEDMEGLGFKPDQTTFDWLIKSCAYHGRLEDSLAFCARMMGFGLLPSCSAVNEMFGKLCENGRTKEADEMLTVLLEKQFGPNETTYSRLISGYVKDGDMEGLTKVLFEMEYKSISCDVSGLSSEIIGLCKCGRLKEAKSVLTHEGCC
ncbi:Pentatricopeptide repeat-containing protein -mitochondrial [Striga hermonthica]|uniref:Pentatricopeptide repeat-containing protein -mitochondrial n=1 Tax=Striga hermonthica TaxID=68872 RepID=A0A9N7N221_STRHE|nr:Pentatricopeptide repeat-containing protein -mitochondrial [Striga hermonthica]